MPATLTDEQITRMAKQRAAFKMHLAAYILVNLFLIGVWFVSTGGGPFTFRNDSDSYYWPIWTHLGWGLGLVLHYYFAAGPGQGLQQREEARIRQQMGKT